MARDFIKINTNGAPQAVLLKGYVQALRSAIEQGERVRAIMNHNHDNVDFSDIESLFGLPAGSGQTVFDLVNGSVGSMAGTFQTADATTITEKLG